LCDGWEAGHHEGKGRAAVKLDRARLARMVPPARQRYLLEAMFDAAAGVLGLAAAVFLRYDFALPPDGAGAMVPVLLTAAAAQLLAGAVCGLYAGRWRFGAFEEVAALVQATILATAIVALANRFPLDRPVPVSATLAYGAIALVVMAGLRWCWRLVLDRRLRPRGEGLTPVIVFGAGEAGAQLITSMMRNPASPYLPVALLDDDRAKRSLGIMGVPVMGRREDLGPVAERLEAEALIIALPSAGAPEVRELSDLAAAADLQVMVLPSVAELFGESVDLTDVRPLTEADLLGRRVIDTDVDAIAEYLTGRRVLVTGAGGSIGSELCHQIYRFAPAELVMLDRDESALHAVQLSMEGRALLDSRNLVVGDVRDGERLDEVFAEHRPEVVFHAAALKHLPLLEMHPAEAYKTNCVGTQNLLDASVQHGVDRFVNVSTDKAADPCSVLGFTKRIAERLTAATAQRAEGTYLSVRFGNVLGSRGSVLTTFRSQIEAGGPITVTDPDVTRYFMTVEEAVQLVIQAGAVGSDGEVLVLDMGEPVRIAEVAQRLIDQAERPIEVVYTGLRTGEKLHEVLLGGDERDRRTAHPLISHVDVPALSPSAIRRQAAPDKTVLGRLSETSTPLPLIAWDD
jgi:FlaA1/EpsC-like NDP-sugar epimerase